MSKDFTIEQQERPHNSRIEQQKIEFPERVCPPTGRRCTGLEERDSAAMNDTIRRAY